MTDRAKEILSTLKSFSGEGYTERELRTQTRNFKQEIIRTVFSVTDESAEGKPLGEAFEWLRALNAFSDNSADKELRKFMSDLSLLRFMNASDAACDDSEVIDTLQEGVRGDRAIMKRICLENGGSRLFFDDIVIFPFSVTVIEIRNTVKNVYIDSAGNYYQEGSCLDWECNIAEEMKNKTGLLKAIIDECNVPDIPVRSVVVFTDPRVRVRNECKSVKICPMKKLPRFVRGELNPERKLSFEEMNEIMKQIASYEHSGGITDGFDVQRLKEDFAVLFAKLEYVEGIPSC